MSRKMSKYSYVVALLALILSTEYTCGMRRMRSRLSMRSGHNYEAEKMATRNLFYELLQGKNNESCQLEGRTEELDIDRKDGVIYFPTCVKVQRCSGCCFGMRKCRATKAEQKVVHILAVEAESHSSITYEDIMTASFIKTTVSNDQKCECQCEVPEEFCSSPPKVFNSMDCTCECGNREEKELCLKKKKKTHRWNENKCLCLCEHTKNCSVGSVFHNKTCTCEHDKEIEGPASYFARYFVNR